MTSAATGHPERATPTTGIVWDKVYLEHRTDDAHPEHPHRLRSLYQRLQEPQLRRRFISLSPTAATDDEILMVHSPAYLAQVKATAALPTAVLSGDTFTCSQSFRVATLAVGGVLEAIRQVVLGRLAHALVLARPPGHHAEQTRAMGFCIFNNVAIGARVAQNQLGIKRVLVVDWDIHHGNGTQHIFERDPSVYFFSSHQFPHFPGTGHLTETGLGPGEGSSMNLPLKRGCGDGEFIALYQRLLIPAARVFRPELILVSAGFDTHMADPLGGMRMTPLGYAGLTRLILDLAGRLCNGRVVFCLEGGYDPEALAASVLSMIDELTGQTRTDVEALTASADAGLVDAVVHRCAQIHRLQ
jgi:acetoin utilization deacetylase AcuC-like enzyme